MACSRSLGAAHTREAQGLVSERNEEMFLRSSIPAVACSVMPDSNQRRGGLRRTVGIIVTVTASILMLGLIRSWALCPTSPNAVSKNLVNLVLAQPDGQDDAGEWEVTDDFQWVRARPQLDAETSGTRERGEVVLGTRKGDWVYLANGDGWMLAKQHLLERFPIYKLLPNGSCSAAGQFPIIESTLCRFAARSVGIAADNVHLRHNDEGYLDVQCYSSGNATGAVCSSLPYLPPSNRITSAATIRERIAKARLRVLRSLERCRRPQQAPCTLLWNKTLPDMVRIGFGSSVAWSVILVSYAGLAGCDVAVDKSFQQAWVAWGVGQFWSHVLPDDEFSRRWSKAPYCGFVHNGDKTGLRCEGPQTVVLETMSETNPFPCSLSSNFDIFLAGLLQIFGPVLLQYIPPFPYTYAALHVRHGDKVIENMAIYGLAEHMDGLRKVWLDPKRVFVTSDDSKVIAAAKEQLRSEHGKKVTLKWTTGEQRWAGGVPGGQFRNHNHDGGAVRAVLSDYSAMALSSVLVGSNHSNFFNTARLLNMALHSDMRWQEPWCWDIGTQSICDNRYSVWTAYGPRLPHQ